MSDFRIIDMRGAMMRRHYDWQAEQAGVNYVEDDGQCYDDLGLVTDDEYRGAAEEDLIGDFEMMSREAAAEMAKAFPIKFD